MGKRNVGEERIFSRAWPSEPEAILWEVLEVPSESSIILRFLESGSPRLQGVRIAIDVGDGYLESKGVQGRNFHLWNREEMPPEIHIAYHGHSGKVSLYKIWLEEDGKWDSQSYYSGMKLTFRDHTMVYDCQDYGTEPRFDSLKFSITVSDSL